FRIDPDPLVVVAAGSAFEANICFSSICGFPRSGVRDVDQIRIVWRNDDAHRARTTASDAMVTIHELPGFAGIIGALDPGIFCRFRGEIHALRTAWGNGDADASQFGGSRKSFSDGAPRRAAVGGFV